MWVGELGALGPSWAGARALCGERARLEVEVASQISFQVAWTLPSPLCGVPIYKTSQILLSIDPGQKTASGAGAGHTVSAFQETRSQI